MSPETVAKTVREYFAALRAMDCDRWVATFAEDARSHDPVDAPAHEGHEGLRQFFNSVTGAFKEVGLTEDHVFIVGREAAVKWTGSGVGKNGRKVHFEGIDLIEVNDDGKIQNLRGYWNPVELMGQLQEQ